MSPSLPAQIAAVFNAYPQAARTQLLAIRSLIFSLAVEHKLAAVDESLKWGEASYLVKGGTAIRIDWKEQTPQQVKVLFHCQTKLIETFREVYPGEFIYEGNRAMGIALSADIQKLPLAHCLQLAMHYQRVKHLPLLGL
ncbi:DUF1801 domain-containing protein [Gilvimarinus sp. DA14]|uniref:DUF1801 domain-containing protein n=1 Tax=Gilvimarinus sp. DA14 TaxID=2956798 RepID=UPI0020B6EC3E|nr:DUF1801 domain-containing protein [Gilvimarinus sp. DA14]UTF60087.1 DUF1801 domain-containing protein [Gilvimarinus sp. DA14]